MHSISYRSRAIVPVDDALWHDIQTRANDRNAALGVTGALLFDGTFFFQTIEGPLQSVSDLMRSIQRDTRHTEIIPFGIRPIERRWFAEWRMRMLRCGASSQGLMGRFGYLNLRDPAILDQLHHEMRAAVA
ncbi:BLUF domain-containing protein [Paracoccus sp. p4-l81]|uniref:BLUF domain-containing protein n=1 Tax=unclassified Paracoccus (in: a-proteobacteria) TaxID=2688777 RepID=UPI0035BB5EA3